MNNIWRRSPSQRLKSQNLYKKDSGVGYDIADDFFAFGPLQSPTVVLNTPSDASSDSDTTPTLDFTGTDADADDIRYQLQIASDNAFTDPPTVGISNLTSGADTDGGSSSTTASISPASNALILLAVDQRTGITADPNQPTISGNGLAWVLIGTIVYDSTSSSRKRVSLFRAMGASPSSGTVTIDFGGQANTDVHWVIDQFTNVDTSGANGSGAIVQSATNEDESGSASSLTVTLATLASTRNISYGAFGMSTETGYAVGSGFTLLGTANSFAGSSRVLTEYRRSPDSTVDMTLTASLIGGIAIEIKAKDTGSILIDRFSGTENSGYSDDFNDNSIHAKWTTYTANGGTVVEQNNRLELTCANTTNGSWAGIVSDTPVDLRGNFAQMRILDGTGGNTYLDLTLCYDQIPTTNRAFISIGVDTGLGDLQAYKKFNGTNDDVMASLPFNAVDHQYVRIREDSGITYWEYSADGSSWTELWSEANPLDMSAVYLVVDDYEYNATGSPGTHIVDSFVVGAWQGDAFVNPDNGGDTDPFTSGENIRFTVQAPDALAVGTYYWRVRGKDPNGTNAWGAWSATRSFTVTSGGGGGTATPSVETMTFSIPAATIIAGAGIAAGILASSFSIPIPSTIGGANVIPSVSAFAVSLQAPVPSGGGSNAPSATGAVFSAPNASASGGSSGNADVFPSVSTLSVSVQSPAPSGGANALPGGAVFSGSVQGPGVSGGAIAGSTVGAMSISVPNAVTSGGGRTDASVTGMSVSMQGVIVIAGARSEPLVVVSVASLPVPSVSGGAIAAVSHTALSVFAPEAAASNPGIILKFSGTMRGAYPIRMSMRDHRHSGMIRGTDKNFTKKL